jgi:hypothetical protein
MCFVLYAGTTKPLPRSEWLEDAPRVCVEPLRPGESQVVAYFSQPEVQTIVSTAGCGCDFPHENLLATGEWVGYGNEEQEEAGWERSEAVNRGQLVELLRGNAAALVELYSSWDDGDFSQQVKSVRFRQEISLDVILDLSFRFKEQGFYQVRL